MWNKLKQAWYCIVWLHALNKLIVALCWNSYMYTYTAKEQYVIYTSEMIWTMLCLDIKELSKGYSYAKPKCTKVP